MVSSIPSNNIYPTGNHKRVPQKRCSLARVLAVALCAIGTLPGLATGPNRPPLFALCPLTPSFLRSPSYTQFPLTEVNSKAPGDAAKSLGNNVDLYVQKKPLQIRSYIELFKNGQRCPEAIEAAKSNVNNKDPKIRKEAIELFVELIKSGQGYSEAIEAAKSNVNNKDPKIREEAIELFVELFKNGQGYSEAIEAAKSNIDDEDMDIGISVIVLLGQVLEQGQMAYLKEAANVVNNSSRFGGM